MFGLEKIIGYPLGWIIWLFYQVVQNYGIALLLFTIVAKLLMVPSSIKQQKSMVKNIRFKPKLDELQKKYGNNKAKYQEEMMKLYEKEGYNPMSGCLPMLIQFPILFGLIDVVYRPLTHVVRLSGDIITRIQEIVSTAYGAVSSPELVAINALKFTGGTGETAEKMQAVANALNETFSADILEKITSVNLNFLGLNLGETPQFAFTWLILIPILSGLTSLCLSLYSMKTTAAATQQSGGGMKGMMYIMPLFSVFFAFGVPAGVGLYWIFSNVFSLVQSMVLYKYYNPQKIAAEMEAKEELEREQERQARIEAKKEAKTRQNGEKSAEIDEKALTAKEINKRKLAEARRRDAEKYGEEYVEVTDDDVR